MPLSRVHIALSFIWKDLSKDLFSFSNGSTFSVPIRSLLFFVFLSCNILSLGKLFSGEKLISRVWADEAPVSKPPPTRVPALPILTLDQAIRLTLTRNPKLAQEGAQVARDKASSIEAGELPDPKLILGEQYFPIPFNMNDSSLTMTTVGIRQSFLPLGKRGLLRRSALREEKASRLGLVNQKELLVRDVRESWLDLYRATEEEAFLRSIEALWEKAFRAALERYRQGIGSEADVLTAQFQKDEIRDEKERLRIRAEQSLHRLMRLMSFPRPFKVSPDEPRIPEPLPEAVLLDRLADHPAFASQTAKRSAQELRVRAAEKDKIPAFSVEGDYSYFMGPSVITTTPNLFSVVLTLNLPVRPGERQDQRVEEAEHELEERQAERDALRQRLLEEIRNAETAYRHLLRRTGLLKRTLLPEARRNVDAALTGYAPGTVTMERVLSAMRKEEEIGIRALSLRTERLKTMAELSYLAGSLQGGSK